MRRTEAGRLVALVAVSAAVGAVLAARRHLDVVAVRGRSMVPAVRPGDRLIVVRLRRSPQPGEVVLAPDPRAPERELVKRVAAVGRAGIVLRGDNVAWSTDARAFGPIPAEDIRWRVVGRYWPLGRAGRVPIEVPLDPVDEGGEPACTVPEALIAGPAT
jgi:nickel-type superoxide dismutase maturation protease